MLTDYHCHILPEIDDGADCVDTSLKMVKMMTLQGVKRIVATPHFYAHKEISVADFLRKRQNSFEKLLENVDDSIEFHLGAEVAVEHGISDLHDIEKLAIQGTRIILLELPYRAYEKWMLEEIYNIATEYKLKVMLAHVHRYFPYYSKEEIEMLLSGKYIFQINNEVFTSWKKRRMAKKIISEHTDFVFGSDSHNLTDRKPNWDLLQKKIKNADISISDSLFEKYSF